MFFHEVNIRFLYHSFFFTSCSSFISCSYAYGCFNFMCCDNDPSEPYDFPHFGIRHINYLLI